MSTKAEKEWEIYNQLEEIRHQQEECDDLQKELAYLEEESHWQNKQVKEVNDDLFDQYPKDVRLQNILLEKEEMLRQKMKMEKLFFEECRDALQKQRRETENRKEEYEKRLMEIRTKEGEQNE